MTGAEFAIIAMILTVLHSQKGKEEAAGAGPGKIRMETEKKQRFQVG